MIHCRELMSKSRFEIDPYISGPIISIRPHACKKIREKYVICPMKIFLLINIFLSGENLNYSQY